MRLSWARIDADVHNCWLRLSYHIATQLLARREGKERESYRISMQLSRRHDAAVGRFHFKCGFITSEPEVLVIVHVLCSLVRPVTSLVRP